MFGMAAWGRMGVRTLVFKLNPLRSGATLPETR